MKLIIITTDTLFEGEAFLLNNLFAEGMPRLHLRKPQATKQDIYNLLMRIEERYYDRIVLHDHFNLLQLFPMLGVHLNRRNPDRPQGKISFVSCSCHSFQNAESAIHNHDYLFLSPIFDSISKSGYNHVFTHEQLMNAKANGWINDNVIALGGINEEKIPLAAEYGFGGVAVLGALWANYLKSGNEMDLIKQFNNLFVKTKKI